MRGHSYHFACLDGLSSSLTTEDALKIPGASMHGSCHSAEVHEG